jgi:hypothetical protein
METTSNNLKKEVRMRFLRRAKKAIILIILVLSVPLLLLAFGPKGSSKKADSGPDRREDRPRMVPEQVEEGWWEWYWILLPDTYLYGRNERDPDERKAEVTFLKDGSIRADIPYLEHGSPEVERLRLTKVGPTTWKGYWEQDAPAISAHVAVDLVAPDVYAGIIIFKNEIQGRCWLRRQKEK